MDKFEAFAQKYGTEAWNAGKRFGILPEIVLAVAAHESGFGSSYSSKNDLNFFGLSASTFYDPEFWDGKIKRKTSDSAGFYRVYSSAQNSFYDFAWLLANASRYQAVIRVANTDYKAFVTAFINSGYFTGPKMAYANALLNYIPEFQKYVKKPFPWALLAGGIGFLVITKNRQ